VLASIVFSPMTSQFRHPPLRTVVLMATGQDLRRCSHCSFCSAMLGGDMDLTLEMLLQLVLLNDDEILTSRTLWSDHVLERARHACANGLEMPAVLLALRDEARRTGTVETNR